MTFENTLNAFTAFNTGNKNRYFCKEQSSSLYFYSDLFVLPLLALCRDFTFKICF